MEVKGILSTQQWCGYFGKNMSKPILSKELLDDIFAIPRDGSNINDDDDTSFVSDGLSSSVPFLEKASEIKEEIAKKVTAVEPLSLNQPKNDANQTVTPVVSLATAIPKIEVKAETKVVEVPKVEPVKVEPTVLVAPIATAPVVAPIEIDYDQEALQLKAEQLPAGYETGIKNAVSIKIEDNDYYKFSGGNTLWKFKTPASKFENFYVEKKLIVSKMLQGGEIPFDKYYEELREINIDVGIDFYDTEEVGKRITEVMKWRDRVKGIQLHINSQYFGFKSFDDLLKGVLARIEYLRGKQEGLIYEHMSDYVEYVSSLEGLYKSLEMVSKHLDAAYASLSRQAAIAQPFQEVERYSTGSSPKPSSPTPMTKALSRFDSVQNNANVSGYVTANKSKEADKTAESPRKGWKF